MEITEKKLLEDFALGRDSAFDDLYRLLGIRIYGFAFQFMGNREDAEDVVAETFIEAYRSRHTFRGRSAVGSWMFRIALRVAYRHLGRRAKHEELSEALEDDHGTRARGEIEITETLAWLSDPLRAAFVLVKLQGFTCKEAANILGKRPGTVQAQVHEATKRIRQRMFGGAAFPQDLTEQYGYEV